MSLGWNKKVIWLWPHLSGLQGRGGSSGAGRTFHSGLLERTEVQDLNPQPDSTRSQKNISAIPSFKLPLFPVISFPFESHLNHFPWTNITQWMVSQTCSWQANLWQTTLKVPDSHASGARYVREMCEAASYTMQVVENVASSRIHFCKPNHSSCVLFFESPFWSNKIQPIFIIWGFWICKFACSPKYIYIPGINTCSTL